MGKYGAKRRLAAEAGQAVTLHGPGHVTTTTTLSVSPAAKKQRMNGKDENRREDSLCWSVGRVKEELCKRGLEDIGDIFEGQRIAGNVLPLITEQRLDEMGIRVLGQKLLTLEFLEEVQSSNPHYRHSPPVDAKVLNDPIHGHIELHPLCISIIDTPQFQRLRQIKQLGACYFVFPGASHNRFEHSLGVCHLAGEMGRALKHRQPELGITDKDVLCLEIAGLCHDLGHGPFSHLFDQSFIPKITPGSKWTHEQASVAMFRFLIDDNNLMEKFKECGLDETDITFICEQIAGPSIDKTEKQDWNYQGRPKNKAFLYEVVANKRNGIDVDKWDYFARDCHCLGIRNNFDHKRFIKFARVLDVEGELQICSRDKEACNLYDMFHIRQALHRRAYQHSVNKIIEHMITEAFIKANDHIKFKGKNGKMLKMSEAIYDMEAYANMTDFVFQQILLSEDNNLAESRGILKRILQRRLYKCVGQTQPKPGKYLTKEDIPQITEELCEILQTTENEGLVVDKDDIVIKVVSLDYGMKNDNPIDHVRFYSKNHPDRAVRVRKDQVSQMLPEKFSEQVLRVFVKSREEEVASRVSECFQIWCERKDMKKAKLGKEPVEMTPLLSSQGSTSSDITPMKTIEEEAEPKASDKCRTRLSF